MHLIIDKLMILPAMYFMYINSYKGYRYLILFALILSIAVDIKEFEELLNFYR